MMQVTKTCSNSGFTTRNHPQAAICMTVLKNSLLTSSYFIFKSLQLFLTKLNPSHKVMIYETRRPNLGRFWIVWISLWTTKTYYFQTPTSHKCERSFKKEQSPVPTETASRLLKHHNGSYHWFSVEFKNWRHQSWQHNVWSHQCSKAYHVTDICSMTAVSWTKEKSYFNLFFPT